MELVFTPVLIVVVLLTYLWTEEVTKRPYTDSEWEYFEDMWDFWVDEYAHDALIEGMSYSGYRAKIETKLAALGL